LVLSSLIVAFPLGFEPRSLGRKSDVLVETHIYNVLVYSRLGYKSILDFIASVQIVTSFIEHNAKYQENWQIRDKVIARIYD